MKNLAPIPVVCALILSAVAQHAFAHARWDPQGTVPPRTSSTANKVGPCGAPRTNNPAALTAGATITLEFESTIYHQGDFRIAFSAADDEGFDDNVLLEDIPDYNNQRQRSVDITLPDTECEQCTLQLIQVMRDTTPPTNYYSCADISLTRSNGPDTIAPAPVSGLIAVPGVGQALLNWTSPTDEDYAGVLVLHSSAGEIAAEPTNGVALSAGELWHDARVVYVGSAQSTTVGGLQAGATSYFSVFAFDRQLNYAEAVRASVDIAEGNPNFAPTVDLRWQQLRHQTTTVDTSGSAGQVVITADVQDDNPGDLHTYEWQALGIDVNDSDEQPAQFTFDPTGLISGLYEFRVTVTDNGEPALSTNASVFIEFGPQPRGGKAGSGGWLTLLFCALLGVGKLHRRRLLLSA